MTDTENLASAPNVKMVDLGRIESSPTQPRKHFDEEHHAELTGSMKIRGFTLSALLVRPHPNGSPGWFELVAGERRWRAAKAAEIKAAPCIIQELTDAEVMEIQLIENIQREDLTPIEEAEHYQRLLELRGKDNKPLYTKESLAARIGKTVHTINRRLSLVNLNAEAREAVEKGVLPPAVGALVARVPATLRDRLTTQVLHPEVEDGPLSANKVRQLLARDYVRDLRRATFDQGEIYFPVETENGERVAGGACLDCPLRDASEQRTSCLNPSCYARKESAEWTKWQERETDQSKRRRALSEAECRRIYQYGNQIAPTCDLVDLADHPDTMDLRPGEPSPGPWRNLIGETEVDVFVVRDRLEKVHELVKHDVALEAAKANGHADIFKVVKRERKNDETRKNEAMKATADRELELAVVNEIVAEVRALAPKKITAFLRLLVDREIEFEKPTDEYLRRYHLPIGGSVARQLASRKDGELVAMLVDFFISEGGHVSDVHEDDRKWLRSIFGIDYGAIAKRVAAQRAKATTKPSKAKDSKPKKTKDAKPKRS